MLTNGKQLDGRYVLREEIGSGGFGAVFRAVDTRFSGNNQVAIKQILLANEEAAKAFRQEADLLYNLTHPNLPKVTNCFQQDGANFIVMEYISGEDLSEALKRSGRRTVADALAIADAVLDALEYLHSFTIFHRDIKPHNIKINEHGKIYLLDFGTAKGNFDEETLPRSGQSVTGFTPFYAPLEQVLRVDPNSFMLLHALQAERVEEFLNFKTDARSDIYGLGATLYHLLTDYFPEKATATTRSLALWSGKSDPLLSCRAVNPEIPEELARIIHRCLEIEPEKRFQTANELRRALKNPAVIVAPQVSDMMTIPLSGDIRVSAREIVSTTEPISEIQSQLAGEATLPPIENLFAARNVAQAKPKSKMPVYLGLLILSVLLGVFGGWLAWRNLAAKPEPLPAPNLSASVNFERILSYSLLVQKMRDGRKFQEPFESSGQEIFENGYQFQMRFTPPADGCVYIFAEGLDARGEKVLNMIFPTPKQNGGIASVAANRQYETGANEFGGATGTENFWLIWNANQPEIAELARENSFQNAGIVTGDALKKSLNDFLESGGRNKVEAVKDTDRKNTNVNFAGDALVYLIRLEHR